MDQEFPRSGDAHGILVGPIPERSACRLHCSVRDNLIRMSNVYTSLRQASEWGMRGLQGSFPRCKKRLPLPSDKDKRRRVLECIIFIHNFRTEVTWTPPRYCTPPWRLPDRTTPLTVPTSPVDCTHPWRWIDRSTPLTVPTSPCPSTLPATVVTTARQPPMKLGNVGERAPTLAISDCSS